MGEGQLGLPLSANNTWYKSSRSSLSIPDTITNETSFRKFRNYKSTAEGEKWAVAQLERAWDIPAEPTGLRHDSYLINNQTLIMAAVFVRRLRRCENPKSSEEWVFQSISIRALIKFFLLMWISGQNCSPLVLI